MIQQPNFSVQRFSHENTQRKWMFFCWNVSGKSASLRRGAPERWHPRQEALPWEEAQPSLKRGLLRYPANQGRPFPITGCIGQPPIKVICDAVSLDIRQTRSQYWAYIQYTDQYWAGQYWGLWYSACAIPKWEILWIVILCSLFPSLRHGLFSLWSQYWALLGLPLLCLFV